MCDDDIRPRPNSLSEDKIPYPLSPVIIETKLGLDQDFTNGNDVINLVHEGNGIFSVETNDHAALDRKSLKNLNLIEETTDSVNRLSKNEVDKGLTSAVENGAHKISTHQEDSAVLRHSELDHTANNL